MKTRGTTPNSDTSQWPNEKTDSGLGTLAAELSDLKGRVAEEILCRKLAEEALKKVQDEIDHLIGERTSELAAENRKLLGEIAKRQATQEYLCASEEIFRTFYERSPIGIQLFNADGKLVRANQACLEIFGVSDFAEISGFDLFRDAHLPAGAKGRPANEPDCPV